MWNVLASVRKLLVEACPLVGDSVFAEAEELECGRLARVHEDLLDAFELSVQVSLSRDVRT